MKTGYRGTFVISWKQVSVDGLHQPPREALAVGAEWSWDGDAVRVDGPSSVLQLGDAEGSAETRQRAARMVRRLVGMALHPARDPALPVAEDPNPSLLRDSYFTVTDGARSFTATLIDLGPRRAPLLMFLDAVPQRGQPHWVVQHNTSLNSSTMPADQSGGVICFTPGTRIRTDKGETRVDELRQGDLVQTKDNGLQEILWTGSRRMTGARLYALPHLRPVRIRAGAFGIQRPEDEFLVSPQHRMLLTGAVARALFNTSEVLVTARDLINGRTIVQDMTVPEITYIHLLLPRHEILFANGAETESFHPANANLSSIGADDKTRLFGLMPEVADDPQTYGCYARRNLSHSEAALLLHDVA